MITKIQPKLFLLCLIVFALGRSLFAQGTAFSYKGALNNGGTPANGVFDLTFSLFDSTNLPGNLIAGPLTNSATPVTNGVFVVTLDFGPAVFTGQTLWLEIAVQGAGDSNFTTLTPRQLVLPVPYAVMANSASNLLGTLPASQLTGTLSLAQLPASLLTNNASNLVLSGQFIGDGSSLTNLNYSQLQTPPSIPSIANLTATNDTRPLVLTNPSNQVAGTFAGAFSGDLENATNLPPTALQSAGATNAQVLTWNGTNWTASNAPPATLSGNYSGAVGLTNTANSFAGAFIGDGSGLLNLNYSAISNPPLIPSIGNLIATNDTRTLALTNPSNQLTGTFDGAFAGDGSELTNLNASSITGTFNGPFTWTGTNTFANFTQFPTGQVLLGTNASWSDFTLNNWGYGDAAEAIFAPSGVTNEGYALQLVGDYRNGVSGERYDLHVDSGGMTLGLNSAIIMTGDYSITSIDDAQSAMIDIGQDTSSGIVQYHYYPYDWAYEIFTSPDGTGEPTDANFPNGMQTFGIQVNGFTSITKRGYDSGSMFQLIEDDYLGTNAFGFDTFPEGLFIGPVDTNGNHIAGSILIATNGSVTVSNSLTAATFVGDGSAVTNINSANITTGIRVVDGGVATLSNGTNQISSPWAYPTNIIQVSYYSLDGTFNTCGYSNIIAGTSFTVFSSSPTDTNSISWSIISPH